jgi:hypothetical protein
LEVPLRAQNDSVYEYNAQGILKQVKYFPWPAYSLVARRPGGYWVYISGVYEGKLIKTDENLGVIIIKGAPPGQPAHLLATREGGCFGGTGPNFVNGDSYDFIMDTLMQIKFSQIYKSSPSGQPYPHPDGQHWLKMTRSNDGPYATRQIKSDYYLIDKHSALPKPRKQYSNGSGPSGMLHVYSMTYANYRNDGKKYSLQIDTKGPYLTPYDSILTWRWSIVDSISQVSLYTQAYDTTNMQGAKINWAHPNSVDGKEFIVFGKKDGKLWVFRSGCTQAPTSCTGNLLLNGDFESGLNAWNIWQSDVKLTSNAHEGLKAARLCGWGLITQTIEVEPNKEVQLDAHLRKDGSSQAFVTIKFFTEDWMPLTQEKQEIQTGADYQGYTLKAISPIGSFWAQITVANADANQCVDLDAFCIRQK